ncbi:MAG: uroporphyrinogen-III synthase [Brachymonas sp.]|nr:uroporphyrinogen-III synthase [Brachymonas sp.]
MTTPPAVGAKVHHLVVTRPQPQADVWRGDLQHRLGAAWQVHNLPLLATAPLENTQPLQQCWSKLPHYHAGMFVSPAAIAHFFAACPDGAQRWNQQPCRAWVVGQGSRQALLAAGVAAELIDSPPLDAEQFDSEALWPLVEPQLQACRACGLRILHVRGSDPAANSTTTDSGSGRNWLRNALQTAGVGVDSIAAYRRTLPDWSVAQRQLAQQLAQHPSHWLLSSRLAVQHLPLLLPAHDWSTQTALATHPRIADAAHALGFGRVLTCRPLPDSMVQSIQLNPCP